MDMDTSQIAGINDTYRITKAEIGPDATLVMHDKILTNFDQTAKAEITVDLNGDGSVTVTDISLIIIAVFFMCRYCQGA